MQFSSNHVFRMYVTGFLPNLDYLDDIKITADQRIRATAPTNVYMMNHSLRNFAEHSMSVPNMRSISKYDAKMDIHMRKHQNGLPIHALKRSGSRFNRFWFDLEHFFKSNSYLQLCLSSCLITTPVFCNCILFNAWIWFL